MELAMLVAAALMAATFLPARALGRHVRVAPAAGAVPAVAE